MRMKIVVAALGFLVLLAMDVRSQAVEAPTRLAQATPGKLVGVAAWNTLVGNSISGKDDDDDVDEFYATDGTVKSRTGNETSTGTWALVGEVICFKYPNEDADCY